VNIVAPTGIEMADTATIVLADAKLVPLREPAE
jgi:hypothetical protein